MRFVFLVALLVLTGCSGDQLSMIVELRTDFAAGVDFDLVETRIDGTRPARTEVRIGQPFAEGRRVAAFDSLAAGTHTATVTLFSGTVTVATRHVVVDLRGSTTITVLVTRDCADIVCPGRGDAPNLTECHGGRCVEPECTPETPEACGTAECEMDADCPTGALCSVPRCTAGACLLAPDQSTCAADERCDLSLGCVPLPVDSGSDTGPADSGLADTGVNEGGVDSGTRDTGPPDTAVPPPSCDDLFGAEADYQLCSESPAECVFYVWLEPYSCEEVCARAGWSCLESHQEGSVDFCMYEPPERNCGRRSRDAVCICQTP